MSLSNFAVRLTMKFHIFFFLDNSLTLIFPDVFGHLTILDNTEPYR